MKTNQHRPRLWQPALLLGLLLASPLLAQSSGGWTGYLEAALVGQDEDGSEDSFRSQWNFDDGFLLEALGVQWQGEGEDEREFRLRAWGFGSAAPDQGATIDWRPAADWRLELEYRRSESFFALAESELGLRQDDWRIDRFYGDLTWDGWKPARLTLGLGRIERSGDITQPFLDLNEIYLLGVDLDETRTEASFRLETRTLPMTLAFEQSFARLERRNQYFPGSERDLFDGDDPDVLIGAENTREEERDIPTSRLTAVWAHDRVEVAGALLWSPTELDFAGQNSTTFGIDGGRVGEISVIDDLVGSTELDALVGQLRVGVLLAPRFKLRLEADHRDRAQDSSLLGQRILRLRNPLGDELDIPEALDESTLFDVVDTNAGVELEYDDGHFTIWGGLTDAQREVDYRLDSGAAQPATFDRDSEGFVVGVAWRDGRRIKVSAEYETDDFERFVFRTDPETVDRLSLDLRARLREGLDLRLRGRLEEADNPADQSSLDRSSDAFGLGLYWTSEDASSDAGLDLDFLDLTSNVALVLPGDEAGLSRYDLELITLSAHGRTELGRFTLSGNATWLDDGGDTYPLESWNARARVAYATSDKTEVSVFGHFFDYNEGRADGDDFEVTRYGVAFAWRYE